VSSRQRHRANEAGQGKPGLIYYPFQFEARQPESYWDEFLVDLGINSMPALGILVGIAVALPLALSGFIAGGIGIALLIWGATLWIKRRAVYPGGLEQPRTVRELVSEVKVSRVRAIPGQLSGHIIGKGIPGLYWSEDLVLQDESGYVVLDYRQPMQLWETLFGLLKTDNMVGKKGTARGWFRRARYPIFELRELELERGLTIRRRRSALQP
jgi:heat shock protein HtpX